MKVRRFSYVCQQNYNYLFKERKIYAIIFYQQNISLLINELKTGSCL